jgi:tetratricopeptide (TPR) repeat protein
MSPTSQPLRDRRGRAYTPAIGPRLTPLLWVVMIGFALLGANGAYLASVTFLEWARGTLQQTVFYIRMFILHLVLGFLLLVPFVGFGLIHLATSWKRPNKGAIRYGIALLAVGLVVLISGVILVRLDLPLGELTGGRLGALKLEVRDPRVRAVGYWLHVLTPLAVVVLYLQHRMAGPRVKWEYAKVWVGVVGVFVLAMGLFHTHDPRTVRRSNDPRYTFPSSVKLADGKLISERALMMDDYCLKCHEDAYKGWFHSSHHFSSFNNKAYLFSVRETRKVALERDGNTRAARWCAGCHDPVPFFSGAFDDPQYDDVNTASSQAGITCTACHAITHINSSRGNGDYTIEEPQHYPGAYSKNRFVQWINNALVKAKPELHKRTFLKPEVHRDSKFCSTCHKVSLPFALNHYQEFTRGQNHWDTFLLSGVAGGNAKSFYYPPVAKTQCAECHMPLADSRDFGARDFDNDGDREIHDHFFPAANTGLANIRGEPDIAAIHERYLKDKKVRVDLFALREGGGIDGKLLGPLRPETPTLQPGSSYLVEAVVRTLGLGHPFSQGTVDSNEIWVELIVRQGEKVVGRSGGIGADGTVDPYAHFINVYMLDRDGNRIDRRNPQDIFVPLYNKQIPPGAGQVVHFALGVPAGAQGPLTLEAKVNYRKFDRKYMDHVYGPGQGPKLPVVVMASDIVQLPVAGGPTAENPPSQIQDTWQRWNDYGIGLLLEGGTKGGQKGELRQAEEVFKKVAELGRADGWVNLARVYIREGRIPDARAALGQAAQQKEPPGAPWVIAWLTGQVNEANGYLDEAIANYKAVLGTRIPARKFDFSQDYEVNNALGLALFNRARLEKIGSEPRRAMMEEAVATWRRTLEIDSENIAAHYGLGLAYAELAGGGRASGASREPGGVTAEPIAITAEDLAAMVARVTDPGVGASPRGVSVSAAALAAMVPRFVLSPRADFGSRLDPLHEVVASLGTARDETTDPGLKKALASALAVSHKALHAMFKPDETAEGRAVAIARRSSPAADQNAQSVVIHPLHRPGAPGLEATEATAETVTNAREATE